MAGRLSVCGQSLGAGFPKYKTNFGKRTSRTADECRSLGTMADSFRSRLIAEKQSVDADLAWITTWRSFRAKADRIPGALASGGSPTGGWVTARRWVPGRNRHAPERAPSTHQPPERRLESGARSVLRATKIRGRLGPDRRCNG